MALVVLPEPTNRLDVRVSDTSASVIPAQVKLPDAAMALANWLALQSVGLEASAVAAVARSIVIELGTSPSVIEAQVRLPDAAMVVANWLALQSVGLAAKAVAVDALPVRAPTKLPAVTEPSSVKFVLNEPLVLPRLIVTSAAPKSAAALGKLLAAMAAQVKLPDAAMVVANWLAEQSVGLEARAVAVVALPLRAPTKLPAVTEPSSVRLVLKAPLVLPRLIVTSAAPRSAAAL